MPSTLQTLEMALGDPDWARHASDAFLLAVGSIVAPTDFAVQHFTDPWHPKFFGHRDRVLTAIQREAGRSNQHVAAVTRCCQRWASDWRAASAAPPVADRIRAGCAALRTWLASLTPAHATRLLRAAAAALAMDDGDTLLESLGFTYSDSDDADDAWVAPSDLRDRIAHTDLASICTLAEALRVLTASPAPAVARTDYLGLTAAAQHWLVTAS